MPRTLLFPLTMLLLIATAMALLASAVLLPRPNTVEILAPAGTAVVEQFYAAVNESIATGSTAPLTRVVHPSFADENPLPGVEPGRAGLAAYLVALHDFDPGLHLKMEVISASAQLVVTRVEVQRDSAAFSTVPRGAARAVWSPIEVFRVAEGVIVRRWGQTDGLTLSRTLAEQRIVLPSPTPRVVSLMRITQAPGTRWDAPRVAGPRLLYLKTGVLYVQSDTTRRVLLTAGKSWQTAAGAIISTTSAGSAEAQLLMVTFSEPKIPNGTLPEPDAGLLPPGVTAQILAGDLSTSLGTGSVTVTLEEIAFAPDASLNLWSTEGPILLAVATGQLESTTRGTAWLRRSRDGMSVASRADRQTTETGLILQPGGMVALRNLERHPANALVVAIQGEGNVQVT